jgi:folate-dependent phosphoribosylglycinamide formyltransferase PurN
MTAAERRIFGCEIESIMRGARLAPVVVDNPNDPAVVTAMRELRPYFLLTHGGPIYGKTLLEVARGVAINQHSGWAPEFKGSNTTDWALYHRSLDYVGCTVHVPISAVDAGPILRRSRPCFVGDESPEAIFVRVAALGTELMIDVVKEIIRSHEITVYDQPAHAGRTWLGSELTGRIFRSIERDYRDGWLREELRRVRSY